MDYVDEVREYLNLPPAKKVQVLRELDSHYREIREELAAAGMSERDAASEAGRRLGNAADLARQLYRVHCPAARFFGLTIALVLGSWLLVQYSVAGLFFPMILVVQKLTGTSEGAGPTHATVPIWTVVAAPLALATSILSVFFAARGLRGDTRRRVFWSMLFILGLFSFALAAGATFAAPHFREVFQDLGM